MILKAATYKFLKLKPTNFLPLIVLITTKLKRNLSKKELTKFYIIYINRKIWSSKSVTKAPLSTSPRKILTSTKEMKSFLILASLSK